MTTEEAATAEAPPLWVLMAGNVVRVTYASTNRGSRHLLGRVVELTPTGVVIAPDGGGANVTIARNRVRGCILMREGPDAGRLRVAVVRAVNAAARCLAQTNPPGGDQLGAARYLSFVMAVMPELAKADPGIIYGKVQENGPKVI